MSKSKGNFYTLPDLLEKGFSPRAIRYLLVSVPYRQKLNFTFDGLRGATSAVERLESLDLRLAERERAEENPGKKISSNGEESGGEGFARRVAEARAACFLVWKTTSTRPAALGALFSFVKATNVDLEAGHLSASDAAAARGLLREIAGDILGVMPDTAAAARPTPLHLPRNPLPNPPMSARPGSWSASRPENRPGRPGISRPPTRSATSCWGRESSSRTRPRACAGRGSLDTGSGFQVYFPVMIFVSRHWHVHHS